MELKTVLTPHVPVRYITGGEGPPLVFLHGAGGIAVDDPLLAKLAERHEVFAPLLPGYGDSEECAELRDMLDITLHYWDVVDALGLERPTLVGHSMGGMIAAEMAAIAPNDVFRLGLICPAGVWRDEQPIADIFAMMPYDMPAVLFHDVEAGTKMMTAGLDLADPKFLQSYLVTNARQLGMAGRLLFPIPDRGLINRMYRIKAKTLIVWGESDKLIPPDYAHDFLRGINKSRLISIPEAGHLVTLERPDAVARALSEWD